MVLLQAYPPIPPHGFFPSPVASSPQGHPYMWGAQVSFIAICLCFQYSMGSPQGHPYMWGAQVSFITMTAFHGFYQ
jgi:hypothetical protein